jgi:RimJ/RimL family protein N-acetyltransferase
MKIPFIIGKRVYLRQILDEDINEKYLSWLNDPMVCEFRTRRVFPSTIADIEDFIKRQKSSNTIHLAIVVRENEQHIGNITLGPINWYHRYAEIAILIGEKEKWGHGYGKEAVYLLSKHAFENVNLHRVYAASPNPTFIKIVRDLNWTKEGELRDAFWYKDRYLPVEVYSILSSEFRKNSELEKIFCF